MKPDERAAFQTSPLQFGGSNTTPEQMTTAGVRMLTDVETAWLAGVIDGEGSIYISKIRSKLRRYRRGFFYRCNLGVANSDPRLLWRVREIIGKGSVCLDLETKQNPKWREKWQYKGSVLVLRGILPQILPSLTIKKEVAEAMLRYLQLADKVRPSSQKEPYLGYDQELDSLYMAVKKLNAKGRAASDIGDENTSPWGPRNRGRGGRATECRLLTEIERAWLAGVIDGEGSLFLSKVKNPKTRRGFFYLPTIGISNTDRAFLVKAAQTIGEGTVCFAKKGEGGQKSRWMYIASSGVLRAVLPQILPYLILKKDRAILMLQFLEFLDNNPIYGKGRLPPEYYQKLDAIYVAMKRLNQKGKGAGIA